MEQQHEVGQLTASLAVTMSDENEEIFCQKPDEQITDALNGSASESVLPSSKVLLSREQQLRLQIQDKQAYSGARCFLYFFEALAMLAYLAITVFQHVTSWVEVFTVVSSLVLSLHHYRRCHLTSTKIQLASVARQNDPSPKDHMQSNPSFYCGYCQAPRGLRIKHCVKCDACIYKYDHHCFWVGNCIGELNQWNFYCFLLTQTVFNCSMAMVFWREPADTWLYWLYMLLLLLALSFAFFTGFLLLYHTMLTLTNQTTWEHIRRHRISYLKGLPKGCHPFSQGLFQNLWQFIRRRHSLTQWSLPPNVGQGHHCDLFDNEYYSCC